MWYLQLRTEREQRPARGEPGRARRDAERGGDARVVEVGAEAQRHQRALAAGEYTHKMALTGLLCHHFYNAGQTRLESTSCNPEA